MRASVARVKMAAAARMLAMQLEQLTKEATGFRSKLAKLTDENTRLRLQLDTATEQGSNDRQKARRFEAKLNDAAREASALKTQIAGYSKNKADMNRQHETKVNSLVVQLKELQEERYMHVRQEVKDDGMLQRRDRQEKGARTLVRDQSQELSQLRAQFTALEGTLNEETARRRKAEKLASSAETERDALTARLGAMGKAKVQTQLEMAKLRSEYDAVLKEHKELSRASSVAGPYAGVIEAAQRAIRNTAAVNATATASPAVRAQLSGARRAASAERSRGSSYGQSGGTGRATSNSRSRPSSASRPRPSSVTPRRSTSTSDNSSAGTPATSNPPPPATSAARTPKGGRSRPVGPPPSRGSSGSARAGSTREVMPPGANGAGGSSTAWVERLQVLEVFYAKHDPSKSVAEMRRLLEQHAPTPLQLDAFLTKLTRR